MNDPMKALRAIEAAMSQIGPCRPDPEDEPEEAELWDGLNAALAALGGEQGWMPIETAPKGGGAEYITDPAWVEPPNILLLFGDGSQSVGYWDWYYAEGGRGHQDGLSAWIEPISGERLSRHYDEPVGWMPLPPPPGGKERG